MVNIFIQPGTAERATRSVEYDSVTDTYARFLLEEILPEVGKTVQLRDDGYSRAMVGEEFRRYLRLPCGMVQARRDFARAELNRQFRGAAGISRHGAARAQAEYPGVDAGWRRRPGKPRAGSWPPADTLINSLKLKGYDDHFSFGVGTHNQAQGSAKLPESLTWLWRDYDPAETSPEFAAEPGEKDKPLWRVVTLNRN
jgi:enterochelin esterase family protein